MTTLERHPEIREPIEHTDEALHPFDNGHLTDYYDRQPSDAGTPVRWIAWTIVILVIAAAAIAVLIITSDTPESFESIYENGSPLAYGAVNEPGFDVGFRWVGESDMTLEEFEMFQAYEASTGEADRLLIQTVGPVSPRPFTTEELAALQASIGEADLKYLQMASTG